MHVTAQSTNLESVPVTNQQQSLTKLESHATESSASSIINSNNKKDTLTSGKKQVQQHGNLDEEVGQ